MSIIIGWHPGKDGWAFTNLVNHLIKAMPDFEHKINEDGDINVLLYPDQFRLKPGNKRTFLHLDGNRWYENKTVKPSIRA